VWHRARDSSARPLSGTTSLSQSSSPIRDSGTWPRQASPPRVAIRDIDSTLPAAGGTSSVREHPETAALGVRCATGRQLTSGGSAAIMSRSNMDRGFTDESGLRMDRGHAHGNSTIQQDQAYVHASQHSRPAQRFRLLANATLCGAPCHARADPSRIPSVEIPC